MIKLSVGCRLECKYLFYWSKAVKNGSLSYVYAHFSAQGNFPLSFAFMTRKCLQAAPRAQQNGTWREVTIRSGGIRWKQPATLLEVRYDLSSKKRHGLEHPVSTLRPEQNSRLQFVLYVTERSYKPAPVLLLISELLQLQLPARACSSAPCTKLRRSMATKWRPAAKTSKTIDQASLTVNVSKCVVYFMLKIKSSATQSFKLSKEQRCKGDVHDGFDSFQTGRAHIVSLLLCYHQ